MEIMVGTVRKRRDRSSIAKCGSGEGEDGADEGRKSLRKAGSGPTASVQWRGEVRAGSAVMRLG